MKESSEQGSVIIRQVYEVVVQTTQGQVILHIDEAELRKLAREYHKVIH